MRDKNNLSHPETPVFMRVSRDYVRDEGFFYKIRHFITNAQKTKPQPFVRTAACLLRSSFVVYANGFSVG